MYKKFHQILGKLFLSCTAFFWFGCTDSNSDIPVNPPNIANEDSSSSEAISSSEAPANSSSSAEVPPKAPFIDIEEELAKLKKTDTTGLKGQCIPVHQYCQMLDGNSSYYAAQGYARSIAVEKINAQHKDNPNYWYGYDRCYSNLLNGLGNAPEYGVPECPSGLTPCETEDPLYKEGARIDDAYIEALLKKEKLYRETLQKTLEQINQGMEKCN